MLLITMNVVVVLSALAGAFLVVAYGDNKEHQSSSQRIRALYIAESGINLALADLGAGGVGMIGDVDNPIAFSHGTCYVSTAETSDVFTIAATANFRDQTVSVEATVREDSVASFFNAALGAKDEAQVLDNAHVDSYDSTLGTYVSQLTTLTDVDGDTIAGSGGHVISNGSVDVGALASVFGDAVTDTLFMPVPTAVSGTTMPQAQIIDFPPVEAPDFTGLPIENFNTAIDMVVPSGNHAAINIMVTATATLLIRGPATIRTRRVIVTDNATLLIDATNGPVYIYPLGGISVSLNGAIRTISNQPKDLIMMSEVDNTTGFEGTLTGDPAKPVSVTNNGDLTGVVYAPEATILISDSGQIYGAVFGRKVSLTDDASLHFDESLVMIPGLPVGGGTLANLWQSTGGGYGRGTLRVTAWRLLHGLGVSETLGGTGSDGGIDAGTDGGLGLDGGLIPLDR